MAVVGIKILFCLVLSCLASEAVEELSPELVYVRLLRSLDNVTKSLKSELKKTQSVVDRIENKIDNIEVSVSALANRINNSEDMINNLENDISSMTSKFNSLERNQEYQEDSFDDRLIQLSKRISEEEARKIAFSSQQTEYDGPHGPSEKVVFDKVIYSYGGGYNSSTGVFTAPKSGTYLFTFNVKSFGGWRADVYLVVRERYKTSAVVEGDGPNLTGGNVGIVYLSYGEKAWIETAPHLDKNYINLYETTFNGILID